MYKYLYILNSSSAKPISLQGHHPLHLNITLKNLELEPRMDPGLQGQRFLTFLLRVFCT